MWNEEEIDHYKSLLEWLVNQPLPIDHDEKNDIAYYSAELLRFKRQF